MKYVKELSTFSARVRLTRVPVSLDYRIVDIDNGRTVVDWTAVPAGADVTFSVPASANAIYQDSRGKRRKTERRLLVVRANAGGSDQFNDKEEYTVNNVPGIDS